MTLFHASVDEPNKRGSHDQLHCVLEAESISHACVKVLVHARVFVSVQIIAVFADFTE